MKAIETTATVTDDGRLIAQVTPDIEPGEHKVILVIDKDRAVIRTQLERFPVISVGKWPEGLSLSREDMYDDHVR